MNTSVQHQFRYEKEGHEHTAQCRCEPRKEVFDGDKGTLVVFIHGKLVEENKTDDVWSGE